MKPLEEKEQVRAGSSSPTPPRKNRRKPKSSPSAPARRTTNGKIIAFEVKVGDKVLISKYGGTEVKIDDENYTIVREDDILGILG